MQKRKDTDRREDGKKPQRFIVGAKGYKLHTFFATIKWKRGKFAKWKNVVKIHDCFLCGLADG